HTHVTGSATDAKVARSLEKDFASEARSSLRSRIQARLDEDVAVGEEVDTAAVEISSRYVDGAGHFDVTAGVCLEGSALALAATPGPDFSGKTYVACFGNDREIAAVGIERCAGKIDRGRDRDGVGRAQRNLRREHGAA